MSNLRVKCYRFSIEEFEYDSKDTLNIENIITNSMSRMCATCNKESSFTDYVFYSNLRNFDSARHLS